MFVMTGCGKKAETNDSSALDRSLPQTESEKYFKGLQDISSAVKNNDAAALEKAINENPGFNLDTFQTDGNTFLITAIDNKFTQIRNILIEKGASVTKASINDKRTPLIAAVDNEDIYSVQILLDAGASLDKKNNEGNTALHVALKKNLEDIAVALIKHGADLNVTDAQRNNALKLAEDSTCDKAFELIKSILQVEFGAPDLASYRSLITSGHNEQLRMVIDRYPRIVNDYEAINPLAILVDLKNKSQALETASILLEKKANVNGPINAEITPLIRATARQEKGFVYLFLKENADPQLKDKDGKSALIHAVELNNFELVDLLISYSANEKYTFRKDDKKITFNACSVAKKVAKSLKDADTKATNKAIQKRLDCGLLSWLF